MHGKWKCTLNELYSLTKNDKCIPENEILSKMGATSWLVKFNLIKTSILSYMLLYLLVWIAKYCKRLGPPNINLVYNELWRTKEDFHFSNYISITSINLSSINSFYQKV